MSDHDFEDYIKGRLYHHVESVDAGGWEQLLAKQAAKKRQRMAARRFYFGVTAMAAAAGLLLLLLIPVLFPASDPIENALITLVEPTNQPVVLPDSLNTPNIPVQIAQVIPTYRHKEKLRPVENAALAVPHQEEEAAVAVAVPTPDSTRKEAASQQTPSSDAGWRHTYNIQDIDGKYSQKSRNVSSKWSIALASTYSNAAGEAPFSPVRQLTSGTTKMFSLQNGIDGSDTQEDAVLTFSPPISVGLNFQKELNRWFSLGVGVNYTLLQSKSSYTYFGGPYTNRQSLHYVGLPVSALFTFVQQQRVRAYASVGGMVEKAVTAHSASWSKYTRSSERSYVQGLQWSVQASLGVEVPLFHLFGLYFEPGIGYFFDNEQPRSIRTVQPAQFKAEFGLRMRI